MIIIHEDLFTKKEDIGDFTGKKNYARTDCRTGIAPKENAITLMEPLK
jgi:hypothetical protein